MQPNEGLGAEATDEHPCVTPLTVPTVSQAMRMSRPKGKPQSGSAAETGLFFLKQTAETLGYLVSGAAYSVGHPFGKACGLLA